MARPRTQKTLEGIAQAALDVFTQVGYKSAQVGDIARQAHLSVGTIYLYAEGKETLFRLAFALAGSERLPDATAGPVSNASMEDVVAEMSRRAREAVYSPLLAAALKLPRPDGPVADELRVLVEELFDDVEASKRRLRLVESCARDWPELRDQWYGDARRTFVDHWVDYLRIRIDGGYLRAVPDVSVAARWVIETCAWFAMHRYGDFDGARLPFDGVRSTIVDLILHALLPA